MTDHVPSAADHPKLASRDSFALPSFLITIDTEGDNVWNRPRRVQTRNAEFLERFQQLCERFGQRPTWLTNHEMMLSPTFRALARDVIARGSGEIGMHLHAWNSPPLEPLTRDDAEAQPYLIEYEPDVMREKIHTLTGTLEDTLGVKMVSHRAGRWSFDERYAEMLLEEGYRVDCSVTPLVSWASTLGDPKGIGGTDYTNFPHEAYWISLDDISRPGSSHLLEVPVTIVSFRPNIIKRLLDVADSLPRPLAPVSALTHRITNRVSKPAEWLRPTGHNSRRLGDVVDLVVDRRRQYAEFMLHSSELMPAGSPTFPDAQSIEALYADLELLFERVASRFRGMTLSEFHDEVAGSSRPER
jgi:hypothetical protein